MEESREILAEIKSKVVSRVIPVFDKYLDAGQMEDINYIVSLIDYCLLDVMNTEKINLLYIELDGLYQYNLLKEPEKTALRIKIKNIMRELKSLIEEGYNIDG